MQGHRVNFNISYSYLRQLHATSIIFSVLDLWEAKESPNKNVVVNFCCSCLSSDNWHTKWWHQWTSLQSLHIGFKKSHHFIHRYCKHSVLHFCVCPRISFIATCQNTLRQKAPYVTLPPCQYCPLQLFSLGCLLLPWNAADWFVYTWSLFAFCAFYCSVLC